MFRKLRNGLFLTLFVLGIMFLFSNSISAVTVESEETLKQAFEGKSATINGTTITLTGDVAFKVEYEFEGEMTEGYDIFDFCEKDYILNLNGYTLTVGELYVNDGSLTINDSTGNGKIDTSFDFLMVAPEGELVINNGNLDYLANEGKTKIKNGSVDIITNYGTIVIERGTFGPIWQRGSATIKGGTFTSNEMISAIDLFDNKTTISGNVEFKNSNGDTALRLYNDESIGNDAINQILGEGYLYACNSFGSNSESWQDEETGETVYRYEASYGNMIIMKDETDAIFNKIAPNGVWKTNGSKPKDMEEADFILTAMVEDIKLPEGYKAMACVEPAEKFIPENVSIFIYYKNMLIKDKVVKAVYNEPSKEVKTKVNSVLDKIAEKTGENHKIETGFLLEDLYLINYLNASSNGMNSSLALNFSKDLIKLTNGGNISYKYDSRLGSFTPTGLWGYSGGRVIVYYDGTAVGTTNIGLTTSNVLYVPSDTANTDEARIAAALKRIEEYLGTTKGITITTGGTLESLNKDGATWKDYDFIDETTSGANYYNVTINGETFKFAICKKDADKLETPEYLASDIVSNIAVKSTSTELPLDTAVSVKSVKDKDIKKALGTDTYAAYDITLYSNTKGAKITKLDNGKFIVSIPVPDSLKGISSDKLTVYYINEKGEKDDYFATVKNGVATFETTHFSTYAIAEKGAGISNPNTSDNVLIAVSTLILSMAGVVVAVKCIKK